MPCVTRNLTRRNPSAERMCDLGRWKNTFSNQILAELSKKHSTYVRMYYMYLSIKTRNAQTNYLPIYRLYRGLAILFNNVVFV